MGKAIPHRQSERLRLFAEAIAIGKSGPDAVAIAGYKSRGKAARNQASRLMANDDVGAMVDKLREKSATSAIKTAVEVKEDLCELMDIAKGSADHKGFVALAARLAKMEGHDEPDRVDHDHEVRVVIGGNAN